MVKIKRHGRPPLWASGFILGLLVPLAGCPQDSGAGPDSATDGRSTDDTGDESGLDDGQATSTGTTTTTDDGVDSRGDSGSGDEADDGPEPLPPLPCPQEWKCREDMDGDGVPLICDNAPDVSNPDQGDMDFDSIGDAVDLCPTLQGLLVEADSDKDGVGNDCDLCRRQESTYDAGLPARYAVRGIPLTNDADHDGIGDACDNCPMLPNCLAYGNGPFQTPYELGMPLDDLDPACQSDADGDGIGDACEDDPGIAGSAGPVGWGDDHDFDQDGLRNAIDLCPRLPGGRDCNEDSDCPAAATCDDGICNHPDPDGDGVGTACDTCPFTANPGQIIDGMAEQDDPDSDFVGTACESAAECVERPDPRPLSFYDVSAEGYCCTTVFGDTSLTDPDGNPLGVGDLPPPGPGVLALPPGCDEALAEAGVEEASRLSPDDVGGRDALWEYRCLLPVRDADFDGLGDACDLCPWAFDPFNTPYVDTNGTRWPNDGAYCNGDYACDA